tara:strand:- start:2123 stop:3367 length:1245 start_codon:yes stop_codon:yes gene_type:complete
MRLILLFLFIQSFCFAQVIPVEIVKTENGFELIREGKPYYVKGVGGSVELDKAKAYGANSFRTWSSENAMEILDQAQSEGLTVCMGLWAQHERHGFDWSNELAVKLQLESFAKVVDEIKDHPALLMWAVGNEVDLFYSNFDVWKHINDITLMIQDKDPHHPVITVTAGLDVAEIKLINKYAPALDMIGINTYGGIDFISQGLRNFGWKKPYLITEWGPNGHWESPTTSWGTPIEQTSTEKATSYNERYDIISADTEMCLGSYVFLWGFKQETTSSWYGLFLKDGSETGVMDVLIEKWSGKKPQNLAPGINSFTINGKNAYESVAIKEKSTMSIAVDAFDLNEDDLSYHFEIVPESTDTKAGGDFEKTPESVYKKIFVKSDPSIKAPFKKGKYRLFVVVKDKEKSATANIPFLIE